MQVLGSKNNSYENQTLLGFTQGLAWDVQLVDQEIRVQKAWVKALAQSGVLTDSEGEQLEQCLSRIKKEIEAGTFEWRIEDEDIHMNIERAVTDALGELGGKLHLGRSRNDLIATTLRLHVQDCASTLVGQLQDLGCALLDKAKTVSGMTIPGSTHLQHGQPVALSHVLLAHIWPMDRVVDLVKLASKTAAAHMPLGAAAFNGTTVQLDFDELASSLGFLAPCHNSYDAVGDRDSILMLLDAVSLHAVHLGRLCEDVIYWASTPISLAKLPKEWSTGSSIMPNKRNPDVCELIRAKAARMIAAQSAAHNLVKSLGSSYFTDLHELKKIYLETIGDLYQIHSVFVPFITELAFDSVAAERLLTQGHILATDHAHALVTAGYSFRNAYRQAAEDVAEAAQAGKQIHETSATEISINKSIQARSAPGGTSAKALERQFQLMDQTIKSW